MTTSIPPFSPLFSIIIPARDEEKFLPSCLAAIRRAASGYAPEEVEIVVVNNRSTDSTEKIAREAGCLVVDNSSKNLSEIRNAGAKAASGKILVTIDADSLMSENLLRRIETVLCSEQWIGGGVLIIPERLSLGIIVTGVVVYLLFLYYRISAGSFFCYRSDFLALNGFNESLLSAEDIDFARRLKAYGKKKGKKYKNLFTGWIVTSCRKFDKFGDWFFLKDIRKSFALLKGKDQEEANRIWYDFER